MKILLIEDNPGDAHLIRELLSESMHDLYEIKQAERLSVGLEYLAEVANSLQKPVDLVLLDLSLPDSQGLDSLIKLRDYMSDIPVVVLTGLDDEALALKALQEGAQDYVVKGYGDSNLLMRVVRFAIERKRTEVALAIAKVKLLESERQRSVELSRSNGLIAALSQVAAKLGTTQNPDQIMETTGAELKKLGVSIAIALFEKDTNVLVFQYTSIESTILTIAEKIIGVSTKGFHVPEGIWPIEKVLDNKQPIFIPDPVSPVINALPKVPQSLLEQALHVVKVSSKTRAIYLPLIIKDIPIGILTVWGDDIRQDDTLAYSVFTNQVAIAIENARLYNEIQQLAIIDELTGLYNRRGFFALAEQQIKLSRRTRRNLQLFFIDVDHLKQINDTFGHQEGDKALIEVAQVLKLTFRSSDIIARMGGDEFAVLVLESPADFTKGIITRIEDNLRTFNQKSETKYTLSMSIGFTPCDPKGPINIDELLARADALMYTQKRQKKENV